MTIMNTIVKKVLSDYLDESGKLKIPSKSERVLIDIGTSFNAPNTEIWTRGNDEVFVLAFEPNPVSVKSLKMGNWIENPYGPNWRHELQLNPDVIGDQVFIVESALSSGEPKYSDFYCTAEDPGTSSLYEPSDSSPIRVDKKITIPTFSLEEIFKVFPWDRFPFIEHVKIDAQSSDYDIILGMGEYIKKILYITVETNTMDSNSEKPHYKNLNEDPDKLKSYVEEFGFECKSWGDNGFFYNKNLREYWEDMENGYEFFNVDVYYDRFK